MIHRLHVLALLALALLAAPAAHAQTDLLGQLEQNDKKADTGPELVEATFKGTRLINGQTVQTPGEGTLIFLISHRFGAINTGPQEFFGLDHATLRLGFEYGFTDRLAVGIGRSTLNKAFDGFVKYKLVRQSTGGPGAMPVSITLLGTSSIYTQTYGDGISRTWASRTGYVYQALIARKFSTDLSIQLMPTLVHRNLVTELTDHNDIYALGVGGRYKITKRFSVNGEYYYRFNRASIDPYYNSVAVGVDIETGGHIFQLHLTNSQGMIERQFITETSGNFFSGYISVGFNLARNFTLKERGR